MDCRDGAECNRLDVLADNTGIISITCIGSSQGYGCLYVNLYAANADELYIYAGYNGIGSTTIYGQYIATALEITAFGTNTSFLGIAEGF